jgi:myosin-1
MDMQFNFKGDPVGGVITDYLLEKSRVVHHVLGERNFHIFYHFLRGADKSLLSSLSLSSNPNGYNYLSQGQVAATPSIFIYIYFLFTFRNNPLARVQVSKVDSINDAENFRVVMSSLSTIGFDANEKSAMQRILAAILHLGNLSFAGSEGRGGQKASHLEHDEHSAAVCRVLGPDFDVLEQVFRFIFVFIIFFSFWG